MKKVSLLLVLLYSVGLFAQTTDSLFTKANEAYKKGNFSEALKDYKTIAKSGKESADLYYNLANTYYKLNQIAPSIYYYEKALQIQPHFEDAKHNLAFAQRMTIDAFEELPKTFMQRINEQFLYPVSYNTWAWLSVVMAFLTGLFFLFYYFSSYTGKKQLYFISSFVSILLLLVFLSISFKTYHHYKKEQPAIVFSPKVSVKSEPLLSAPESFVLHEGTKVQVENKVDDWYKIKLSDGKIGWISKEAIKKVKD